MSGIPLQGGQRIAAAHITNDFSAGGDPPFPVDYCVSEGYPAADGFDVSAGIQVDTSAGGLWVYTLTLSQSINYCRSIIIATPILTADPNNPGPLTPANLISSWIGVRGPYPDPAATEGNTITVSVEPNPNAFGGYYGDFFIAVYKIN